jgi:hypothetical protein
VKTIRVACDSLVGHFLRDAKPVDPAMDLLPLDWKWQGVALLSTAYLTACHLLRYRFRDRLRAKYPYKTREDLKSMTMQDAYEIHNAIFATEFPFMFEKALEFALFRFDIRLEIIWRH